MVTPTNLCLIVEPLVSLPTDQIEIVVVSWGLEFRTYFVVKCGDRKVVCLTSISLLVVLTFLA